MQISVPYGQSTVSAQIPERFGVDIIEPADPPPATDPLGTVRRALAEPVGDFTWPAQGPVGSVAIAVNDKTRPVPHHDLLPPLIDRLVELGTPDRAISFHIAVGGHPPMRPDEFATILPPEIVERFQIISHDSESIDALTFLGDTPQGTPVWANRRYVEADCKIVVGTIEPHQFVGFSGGVKSAAIGLAGRATINANHTLMGHPDSQIGEYETNPARQDVEAIGELIGVDLALNAILDQERRIVEAVAGEPVAVMKAGVPLARQLRQVPVDRDYELVIASPGGHPKDINVYQSQKALAAAARIVRPGGTIILTAACPDGSGSEHYEQWVSTKGSQQEVLDAFADEGFRLGPHKAYQIARDTRAARLVVCSDMPDELAHRLLMDVADGLQTAIDDVVASLGPQARIAVLPHASTTVPTREVGSTPGE